MVIRSGGRSRFGYPPAGAPCDCGWRSRSAIAGTQARETGSATCSRPLQPNRLAALVLRLGVGRVSRWKLSARTRQENVEGKTWPVWPRMPRGSPRGPSGRRGGACGHPQPDGVRWWGSRYRTGHKARKTRPGENRGKCNDCQLSTTHVGSESRTNFGLSYRQCSTRRNTIIMVKCNPGKPLR